VGGGVIATPDPLCEDCGEPSLDSLCPACHELRLRKQIAIALASRNVDEWLRGWRAQLAQKN
jgi:hypothetical protein